MSKKLNGWYSVSFTGGLILSIYGLMPPLIVYADTLGALTPEARASAVGFMLLVTLCAGIARSRGHKLFSRHKNEMRSGFTLVELLVVMSVVGILAAIIYPAWQGGIKKAYFVRAEAELQSIAIALRLYINDYDDVYPADVNRDLPPGLEAYLSGSNWPKAPWPGSVYDWDAWAPSALTYEPKEQVYQISIRFCPLGQPTQCNFPSESWAANFDYYSSVYYCISGPCRAHSSQPINHPAYCVNC